MRFPAILVFLSGAGFYADALLYGGAHTDTAATVARLVVHGIMAGLSRLA